MYYIKYWCSVSEVYKSNFKKYYKCFKNISYFCKIKQK